MKTLKIIIAFFVVIIISNHFLFKKSIPKNENFDAIIILGNSNNPNNIPNQTLTARLDKGIEFYKNGWASKLIFSGAAVKDEISEAEIMYNYALKNGILPTAIIKETNAQSTVQNFQFCSKIMQQYNFKNALIVTSSYHIPRSKLIAKKYFPFPFEFASAEKTRQDVLLYTPIIVFEKLKHFYLKINKVL